jgi:hypothetical protein
MVDVNERELTFVKAADFAKCHVLINPERIGIS